VILDPESDEEETDAAPRKKRLRRATKYFLRVPETRINDRPFNMTTRLLFRLIVDLREGCEPRRSVRVTSHYADKARISRRSKNRCLRVLEETGWVDVDWSETAAPLVTMRPIDL
jgi:hypothetical protein